MTSLLAVLLFAPFSYCSTQDIKVPIKPEVVLEPVRGVANFLKKEGFEMTAPRFHSDWVNSNGQTLDIACIPSRIFGGRVIPKLATPYDAEIKYSNRVLKHLHAKLATSIHHFLRATLPCPGGELRLTLGGSPMETPKDFGPRTSYRDYKTAKPMALDHLAELATKYAKNFKNPKWFESLQMADKCLAAIGYRRFTGNNPAQDPDMQSMPDWYKGEFDLSITFGPLKRNATEIDIDGLPVPHGAGGMRQCEAPELEKLGIKACYCGNPSTLASAFVSRETVYRIFLHAERYADSSEPYNGRPFVVKDKELLSRFCRVVIGIKELADANSAK